MYEEQGLGWVIALRDERQEEEEEEQVVEEEEEDIRGLPAMGP